MFHVQYASNRKVALSILFDTQEYYDMLEMTNDTSRLKTCFVNAFDFGKVEPATGKTSREEVARNLTIPLFEFMRYIWWNESVYYQGSETEPPCSETVTWIVNLRPHVITENQVNDLKSLLS